MDQIDRHSAGVLDPSALDQGAPIDPEALIEEARRARRRRYRRNLGFATVVSLVVLALSGTLIAMGNGGTGAKSRSAVQPNRPSAPLAGPTQTVPAGTALVGRGPTAVDFSDSARGWIASGAPLTPQGTLGDPAIVRTTDGGQSWVRSPVPDLAAQAVDPAVWHVFGGLVGVDFVSPLRGWYFQVGLGWQTNDGGRHWVKMSLPVEGALAALTSSGDDVWALLETCPIHAISCPQNLARGSLFHATSAANLHWQRVGSLLPGGFGSLYPTAGHGVLVALGGQTFHRSADQRTFGTTSSACSPVGSLSGGAIAGICGVAGGGDASVTRVAVSSGGETTWQPLLGGPPSSQWEGTLTTNGTDAIFYVTGGQTLWRTGTTQPGWQAVLRVPASSPDEIYPVYLQGNYGLALVGDGASDVHWFETNDSGLTWQSVTLP
jgi:hypothetical protein